ncbi:hypothetical protein GCM10023116_09880 [Kistimonas scapharcae]|uniref:ATP-dependent Clp protease proteolytic subunit n=1 Tax=Kistimonas scapharcae TaxID=1036133 RepID=A0ABP8UYL9_9GAMM
MSRTNKPWYTLKNQSGNAELMIYDVIGDWAGLSARQLVDTLKTIDIDAITVRINSPGGSVFDGIAIYNALRYHPANITVRIEGLAASIASVIAMAGDTVQMAENALFMIHNPFGWVSGEADDLRRTAGMLDKARDSIAMTYSERCGLPVAEIVTLMAEETWFTAAEAKEKGLIDSIDKPVQLAASFDLSLFNHAPPVKMEPPAPKPATKTVKNEPEDIDALAIVRLCNQAGYPELAEACIRDKQNPDQVREKFQDCESIKSLCAAAHAPDLAAGFIQSANTVDEVRAALFEKLTANAPSVNNTLTPDQQQNIIKPLIDTAAVYRNRNGQTSPQTTQA